MRKILLALFIVLISVAGRAQFTAHVDSVYAFMKFNSIHHKKVNWEEEDKVFKQNMASARTLDDTVQCFVQVLEALDDVHSHFTYNNRNYGFWKPTPDSTLKLIGPLLALADGMINMPTVEILADDIIYVRVPGYRVWEPQLVQKYAQALHDSITQYNPKKLKGVILDLRLNTGGNAYPMLAGLSCMLNGATVAYQTNMNDSITGEWKLADGNLLLSGTSVVKVKGNSNKAWAHLPVVVLTGPVTSSSGSLVAIAFRGRENSTSMGESTAAGYTTCNGYYWFNENLSFNFAVSNFADRNRQIYWDSVFPDVELFGTSNFVDPNRDKLVDEARNWIPERKGKLKK